MTEPDDFSLPEGFQFWHASADELSIAQVIARYEAGFAGAFAQPGRRELFHANLIKNGGNPDGDAVATESGLVGGSEGGLHLPWLWAADAYGANPFPGRAQGRGDCVSHGTANAACVTLGVELFLGKPDEVTGRVEGFPTLAAESLTDCVLSCEAIYWWRRHGGDGWSCADAANVLCHESGMWLRKEYPELKVDLSRYNATTAGLYGARTPPENFKAVGADHLMRTATEPGSWEAAADFLASGYGVNSCGGQAWSSKRDEHGFSPTTNGGWSHSQAFIGVDRRPWVQQKYRTPALFLMLNSWGTSWNGGPRDVYESAGFVPAEKKQKWIEADLVNSQTGAIMIPEGSYWCDCKTLNSRYLVAFSSAAGWPSRDLPSLSLLSG